MSKTIAGHVKPLGDTSRNGSFAPAFVFGVPRSGTTLLVNLVGSHPLVAPLYETRFLRNLVRFCDRASWLGPASRGRKVERFFGGELIEKLFLRECEVFRKKAISYHHDSPPMCIRYTAEDLGQEMDMWLHSLRKTASPEQGIYNSAREFVDRLFAIHCRRMNKPYWINKTPGLLNHLDGLSRLYPDAKCLHIIRDGRDVAVSNLGQKWGPNTIGEAACRWKSLMRPGRAMLGKQVVSFTEVRYENLIRAPARTLQEIFEFLRIDGTPEEILEKVAVHDQSVGSWRRTFTAADRLMFHRAAGDLLIDLGYEKDSSWSD